MGADSRPGDLRERDLPCCHHYAGREMKAPTKAQLARAKKAKLADESARRLSGMLVEGATIWTTINSARSGASHQIRCYCIPANLGGKPGELSAPTIADITYHVARATCCRWDNARRVLVRRGGGMDMAWDTVNSLSYALKGYAGPNQSSFRLYCTSL